MGEQGRIAPPERTQPLPGRLRVTTEPFVFARGPPHDESVDRAEFVAKLRGVEPPVVAHPAAEDGTNPFGDVFQIKVAALASISSKARPRASEAVGTIAST